MEVVLEVVTEVVRAGEDGFGLMVEEETLMEVAVGLLETFVVVDRLTSAIMMHWPF